MCRHPVEKSLGKCVGGGFLALTDSPSSIGSCMKRLLGQETQEERRKRPMVEKGVTSYARRKQRFALSISHYCVVLSFLVECVLPLQILLYHAVYTNTYEMALFYVTMRDLLRSWPRGSIRGLTATTRLSQVCRIANVPELCR